MPRQLRAWRMNLDPLLQLQITLTRDAHHGPTGDLKATHFRLLHG